MSASPARAARRRRQRCKHPRPLVKELGNSSRWIHCEDCRCEWTETYKPGMATTAEDARNGTTGEKS